MSLEGLFLPFSGLSRSLKWQCLYLLLEAHTQRWFGQGAILKRALLDILMFSHPCFVDLCCLNLLCDCTRSKTWVLQWQMMPRSTECIWMLPKAWVVLGLQSSLLTPACFGHLPKAQLWYECGILHPISLNTVGILSLGGCFSSEPAPMQWFGPGLVSRAAFVCSCLIRHDEEPMPCYDWEGRESKEDACKHNCPNPTGVGVR